jgi:hypothetical protein
MPVGRMGDQAVCSNMLWTARVPPPAAPLCQFLSICEEPKAAIRTIYAHDRKPYRAQIIYPKKGGGNLGVDDGCIIRVGI